MFSTQFTDLIDHFAKEKITEIFGEKKAKELWIFYLIQKNWNEIAMELSEFSDPAIYKISYKTKSKDGKIKEKIQKLILCCNHPYAKHRLNDYKLILLERINSFFSKQIVDVIEIKLYPSGV